MKHCKAALEDTILSITLYTLEKCVNFNWILLFVFRKVAIYTDLAFVVFRYLYNRYFLLHFDIHKIFLQYHKEVVRLMSGEFRQKIGDKYISFARKWMNYVLTKCESGRGTRPR